MSSPTTNAWDWDAHRRKQASGSSYRRPGDMLADYGTRQAKRCGECASYAITGAGPRCLLSCAGQDTARGYTWIAAWKACGRFSQRQGPSGPVGAHLGRPDLGPTPQAIALPLPLPLPE